MEILGPNRTKAKTWSARLATLDPSLASSRCWRPETEEQTTRFGRERWSRRGGGGQSSSSEAKFNNGGRTSRLRYGEETQTRF
ncbi:unnamed protein product [Brassica oleracea var. botrytis]